MPLGIGFYNLYIAPSGGGMTGQPMGLLLALTYAS